MHWLFFVWEGDLDRDVKRICNFNLCCCTKTDAGIEASLSHNRLWMRRDVFGLCQHLPLATSPIDWCGRRQHCRCLITPPEPRTSLYRCGHTTVCLLSNSHLLQSAFTLSEPYHALCSEANSSWHVAIGDLHWADINEHKQQCPLNNDEGDTRSTVSMLWCKIMQ